MLDRRVPVRIGDRGRAGPVAVPDDIARRVGFRGQRVAGIPEGPVVAPSVLQIGDIVRAVVAEIGRIRGHPKRGVGDGCKFSTAVIAQIPGAG